MNEERKKKKDTIEYMVKEFITIETKEEKDLLFLCMMAYKAGRESGKAEKQQENVTA